MRLDASPSLSGKSEFPRLENTLKERTSSVPEFLLERMAPLGARCLLPAPEPSTKGLCREFQRTSSFLPALGPGALRAGLEPEREDWCVGLPSMVMENGSSGEPSRGSSAGLEETGAPVSEGVLKEMAKGSPCDTGHTPAELRALPSWGALGLGFQGSELPFSLGVRSKSARKGSHCLLRGVRDRPGQEGGSHSEEEGRLKAAKVDDKKEEDSSSPAPLGLRLAGSQPPGEEEEEGSRDTVRKGSPAEPASLLCDVTAGQAAQVQGSGEGPRG